MSDPRVATDLRAAVVGTGFIGRVHVGALRRLGVEVTGVLGSSPERARLAVADIGVRNIYDDFQQILDDPRVDVVHIASPNSSHFDQAKRALLAGKHVVCEKPLAVTSEQTRELRDLARDSGLVHAVNYNVRFYPQVVEARSRIAAPAFGDIRLITGSYRQDWLSEDTDWNWRIDDEVGGPLRSVADIGSHLLDLLEFVTGRRVTQVLAELMTFMPVRHRPVGPVETFGTSEASETEPVDVTSDDAAVLLLRFEDGARGSLAISQVSIGHRNALEFEVTGSRSSVSWNSDSLESLWIGHRDEANQVLARDPALLGREARSTATVPGGHAEGFENTFAALYRSVYSRIVGSDVTGDPMFATFEDGHREAVIMDAILRSARGSIWTDVPPEPDHQRESGRP